MTSHSTGKHPSLTAVVHAAAKTAQVDTRTLADVLGKPYQTFMSEISQQPGHKFGADLLLPFMKASGNYAPMHFLAREMGGVFIPINHHDATPESELLTALTATIKEFSNFCSEVAHDISDGQIPSDQLARINSEGHEAVTAIMNMLQLAQRTHERQYGKRP